MRIFARLKPYSPEKGQPHKQIMLSALGMRFQEGVFIELPEKIATRLQGYLEQQYPDGDTTRPCLYQVVSEKEMEKIIEVEAEQAQREKEVALLGASARRQPRIEKSTDRSVVRDRQPSLLEQLAEEVEPPKEGIESVVESAGETTPAGSLEWDEAKSELEESQPVEEIKAPSGEPVKERKKK